MEEKSRFNEAVREQRYPLLIEQVNLDSYNTRKIHRVFPKASRELDTLIINLAHNKRCAVRSRCYCLSRYEMKEALQTLLDNKYLELAQRHYHNPCGTGTAGVYQRTVLFEERFRFRLPERIVVLDRALSPSLTSSLSLLEDVKPAATPLPLYGLQMNLKSGTEHKKWQDLVRNTRLTLSTGKQVFERVWLVKHQARWFQKGIHGYQSLPKRERKCLLINGERTVELDYKNLHPNLLLNMVGSPCDSSLYEHVLRDLGLRVCKSRRKALKLIVLVAINIGSASAFTRYVREKMTETIGVLGVPPSLIRKSLKKLYPMLSPFICTGKHALMLQQKDSEIMEDVLETLAGDGVVALPLHDSVIVPAQHKESAKRTMIDCYKRHTGFAIEVK